MIVSWSSITPGDKHQSACAIDGSRSPDTSLIPQYKRKEK